MAGAQPAARQAPAGAEVTARRLWLTAIVLGALVLVLFAACVVLTFLTRDLPATFSGAVPVLALGSTALGVVIARRQPRNPIGWLLIACGGLAVLFGVADLYAVLDYQIHHGALPGGPVAVFAEASDFLIAVLFGLAILLFPDGTLPSRRWRWSCGRIWPSAPCSRLTSSSNSPLS